MSTPGKIPAWVQDTVFYQIFPDRFANGDPAINPANMQPWGTPPTRNGFMGGDLRGVLHRLDYLQDLGINAIYFNPIFLAASNHRYNAFDYFQIDPKLGNLKDFQALVDAAHRAGIRIVLDGVFNHCGRGFFAFSDLLENQAESPYRDWFHVKNFPVSAYGTHKNLNYEAWWGYASLPKFNTANPQVRRYIMEVARYWIEQGADGWRLDVPNEIDDDSFWEEFRHTVRSVNSEAYLLGEIWDGNPRWVSPGHFDGLMHYPLRSAIFDYLAGKLDGAGFTGQVQEQMGRYSQKNVFAMYLLLGSHDTERALTALGGNLDKLRLAYLLLFSFPGAPAVYYGDEVGLEGGKDPDCRRAFSWDESTWNTELRAWLRQLIAHRRGSFALRRGEYLPLAQGSHGACAFARRADGHQMIIVANPSRYKAQLEIPASALNAAEGQVFTSPIDRQQIAIADGVLRLTLPPVAGNWFAVHS